MFVANLVKHAKTVFLHKFFVCKYCFLCGLYLQGILHDLSKFSPVEFFESVRYYSGTQSPINLCKKDKGYSKAWFHHRGRNKHHWEFWCDNFEKGMTACKMPYKYALEMICDFLGAGAAYGGGKLDIDAEYKWWLNKRKMAILHPDTKALVDYVFLQMKNQGVKTTLKGIKKNSFEDKYNRSEISNTNIIWEE